MKNYNYLILLFLSSVLILSGCSTTFGGTVLVLNFKDLIYYVLIALALATLIAFKSPKEKRKKRFWIWFILSLVITPLAGLIYAIVLFTRKTE